MCRCPFNCLLRLGHCLHDRFSFCARARGRCFSVLFGAFRQRGVSTCDLRRVVSYAAPFVAGVRFARRPWRCAVLVWFSLPCSEIVGLPLPALFLTSSALPSSVINCWFAFNYLLLWRFWGTDALGAMRITGVFYKCARHQMHKARVQRPFVRPSRSA